MHMNKNALWSDLGGYHDTLLDGPVVVADTAGATDREMGTTIL